MAVKIKNAEPAFIDFPALKGSYGRVWYFVTKAGLRDVAENLSLAPQDSLSFTQRIQRVINLRRVEEDILPYLQSNEHRFFNALVCVLLPDREKSRGVWDFQEYTDEDGNGLGGLGKLRITKDVARVVLDGQHRFEALKRYWDTLKETPNSPDAQIEIPLMFVVADDLGKIGKVETNLRSETITYARNLFAVLNKTARSVDNTTLLLIDDMEVANLATRRLIEEEKIDELYVKWIKAPNLQPTDPYFTAIHVIKDSINFYLRDHKEELSRDLGSEQEREDAMERFYENTPGVGVPLENAIGIIFTDSSPYIGWQKAIKKAKVNLIKQPGETVISKDQGGRIRAVREKELAYTVAGQRAFFKAIIDAFFSRTPRDSDGLKLIIRRANKLFDAGLYRRKIDKENPFSGLLFDNRNRMLFADSVVECARKILSVALGSRVNKEAILEEYRGLTGLESDVVEAYWEKAKATRTPDVLKDS
jgi:DGQHR domain-containing protein